MTNGIFCKWSDSYDVLRKRLTVREEKGKEEGEGDRKDEKGKKGNRSKERSADV